MPEALRQIKPPNLMQSRIYGQSDNTGGFVIGSRNFDLH